MRSRVRRGSGVVNRLSRAYSRPATGEARIRWAIGRHTATWSRRAGGQVQPGQHVRSPAGGQDDPDAEPADQRAGAQAGRHEPGRGGKERDPDRGPAHAVVAHLREQQHTADPSAHTDEHERGVRHQHRHPRGLSQQRTPPDLGHTLALISALGRSPADLLFAVAEVAY